MSWIDWLIVIIPVAFVFAIGIYSTKYIRSVADFLSAGRICGRYIINVGDIANALSIIVIIASVEVYYKTGFALSFWQNLMLPMGMVMGLTGFCYYRFRETKAMSLGQFLEMRYSRSFRIFAACLRTVSEILANAIMPAVASRFFIYFLDLPRAISFWGVEISTFALVMLICLVLAISIIYMGGTLALIITDALQGMLLYPIMAILVVFIIVKFNWSSEIVPILTDRAAGESFMNPFDIKDLNDFNVFFLVMTLFVTFFHHASWIGAGTTTAAKTPHEAKMGGLLGTWRNAINIMLMFLLSVMVLIMLNHKNYAPTAKVIRQSICEKINEEPNLSLSPYMKGQLDNIVQNKEPLVHTIGVDKPLSDAENLDTIYLGNIKEQLLTPEPGQLVTDKIAHEGQANKTFQQYKTLYYQQMIAGTMRHLLPTGIAGLFILLMVMAMISTDDTRIYSSALTFTQDVIVPLSKKEISPENHIRILRLVSILVGVIFFVGSMYMAQLDYINLFVTIVTMMWMGGCGPVMIFGLYSRFGTTAGAWTSLITGMLLSIGSIAIQRNWADVIYPYLQRREMVDSVGDILYKLSSPFHPYIEWTMNLEKCPINSYEFYFMTMVITLILYVVVSYATCKTPFNLDCMLHRGKYNLDGENKNFEPIKWKNIFKTLISITPEYTKGDKFIAWAFFAYSFIYQFGIIFLFVLIWNLISPWEIEWWSHYFFIVQLVVPGIMAFVSMFWFGIGGTKDMIQLFKDLEKRVINHLDNGMVSGSVSLADKKAMDEIDNEK